MSTSPKSNNDNTLSTGRSEPDRARPVHLQDRKDAGLDKGGTDAGDDPRDAGDIANEKHGSGKSDEAAPGAIPPEKLTTETDDGSA